MTWVACRPCKEGNHFFHTVDGCAQCECPPVPVTGEHPPPPPEYCARCKSRWRRCPMHPPRAVDPVTQQRVTDAAQTITLMSPDLNGRAVVAEILTGHSHCCVCVVCEFLRDE